MIKSVKFFVFLTIPFFLSGAEKKGEQEFIEVGANIIVEEGLCLMPNQLTGNHRISFKLSADSTISDVKKQILLVLRGRNLLILINKICVGGMPHTSREVHEGLNDDLKISEIRKRLDEVTEECENGIKKININFNVWIHRLKVVAKKINQ